MTSTKKLLTAGLMTAIATTATTAQAELTINSSASQQAQTALDIQYAGALEFTPDGTLFVGDNVSGAIYAFDVSQGSASVNPANATPIKIDNIDTRIANLLGVSASQVEIHDMAVNPVTQDIYISVARIGNQLSTPKPVLVKVAQNGNITLPNLADFAYSKQTLDQYPQANTTFKPRGLMSSPPTAKDLAKGDIELKSLAIMDMEYHNGELYIAGVATDNFLSSLRKVDYPFTGKQSITNVEVYHIAHDQYETRAPIRSMSIQTVDGKEQLIAAYTCSPIVMIPLDEIQDGAKITGKTIGDMGNGQPIDMIPYTLNGTTKLFVTSNSRSPRVIAVDGENSLQNAKTLTYQDFPRGPKLDGMGVPVGAVGQTVMFEGSPMQTAKLGDNLFTSIVRDTQTGGLNLDSNPTFFPNRVHNLVAEYDFPQYFEETNPKNEIIKQLAEQQQ